MLLWRKDFMIQFQANKVKQKKSWKKVKNLNMNRIFWIIPLFLTLLYCESDDICPESTPTTPRLIITFYDVENPESKKNIESLGIYTVNNGELNIIEGINGVNTDSIAIPLRDDESVTNFKFCKDCRFLSNSIFGNWIYTFILNSHSLHKKSYQTKNNIRKGN